MRKFIKMLSVVSILFLMIITMSSCSEYNFYDDFHNAGATIEEDNVFEVISLEKAKLKKEAGDVFVIVYGMSSNTSCVKVITSLQAQAEYLGNLDATIYYLNSSDFKTKAQRDEVRSSIGMHEPTTDGSPVVMTFRSTAVDVDTSNKAKSKTKKFLKDGVVQYASLASYIYKELLV